MNRGADILFLARLIATSQQYYDLKRSLSKVDAIAWPSVDAYLRHPLSDRLAITEMPVLDPVNASLNPSLCLTILHARKPVIENSGGKDRFHGGIVAHGLQRYNT